jgi:predicted nuclease of restriction endonuclease-like (RecB) superfamily
MTENITTDRQYKEWLVDLKGKIQRAQVKAALSVNQELLRLYWELGKEILEKEKTTEWGDKLIEQLSKDLLAEYPGTKGFSRANLYFIRKWSLFYSGLKSNEFEFVSQLVRQIPWGHNREIITHTTTVDEAIFYVRQAIQNNWSRSMLSLQIESNLYNRQGKALHNFDKTLPPPQADLARELLKNPYNFDFLTLENESSERNLENDLVAHIQKFLLELGQGFAFMGRQYRLDVGGEDFYLDLLFYHTKLRCYFVIEIKTGKFKPEYTGKLNFYLNVVNAQLKHDDDKPSIGILLCKTPSKIVVDYALQNVQSPLGVTEYQLIKELPEQLRKALPSREALEERLNDADKDDLS